MKITLRLRVKDKHRPVLDRWARSVNFVWNYVNELTASRWEESRAWLSGHEVEKYVAGASRVVGLPADSLGVIAKEHGRRRKQYRKSRLRWRSNRKSLGWVPFRDKQARWKDGAVVFAGQRFHVWDSYGLGGYQFRSGSFSADARGRWYFNVVVEVLERPATGDDAIGVDLGLKSLATYSDDSTFDPVRQYRDMESRLAVAQRARKKRQVVAIHAKIANRRKDALHKESTRLARAYRLIAVGDVSAVKLARTRMAKSVLDAGWSTFRTMLSYKAIRHSATCVVVPEHNTTRACSSCQALTGPAGVNGLRVREWTCRACGVRHDRDGNAARNILRLGCETLIGGAHVA